MKKTFTFGGGLRPLPRLLLLGVLSLPVAACDRESLLEVDDPDFVPPSALETESGLPVLAAGALADFGFAYAGGQESNVEGYAVVSALLTDEFYRADTFIDRQAVDQRDLQPVAQGNRSDQAFARLQTARRSLRNTIRVANKVTGSGNSPIIARARALEGFTYVALGEGYCSAIPFSDAGDNPDGPTFTGEGTPLSTAQVFDTAVARFDEAIAVATAVGNSQSLNLARIGKGRALLNNGRFAEAAAAVAAVPTNYTFDILLSSNTTRQSNAFYGFQDNGRFSQSDREGGNGLPFRSAGDERTPFSGPFQGFDSTVPLFLSDKYLSLDDDVTLASGVEARLIEAEAALRANDGATFIARINAARAELDVDPATDPGTAEGRRNLLFSERGFSLYLTGHRLGDLRRLVRQYGLTQAQVYPTGAYFSGGVYGDDVNFPVPFTEENNTLYEPAQCNTTRA